MKVSVMRIVKILKEKQKGGGKNSWELDSIKFPNNFTLKKYNNLSK